MFIVAYNTASDAAVRYRMFEDYDTYRNWLGKNNVIVLGIDIL